MAACVNALSVALLQTSIPLKASVVAFCSTEFNDSSKRKLFVVQPFSLVTSYYSTYYFNSYRLFCSLAITLVIDVSDPALSANGRCSPQKKCKKISGDDLDWHPLVFAIYTGSDSTSSISPSDLISLSSYTNNRDLKSRALDLFDAMITQLASNASNA